MDFVAIVIVNKPSLGFGEIPKVWKSKIDFSISTFLFSDYSASVKVLI